jgi:15-hydroxyprostaglandin dehydrogenase (NAD)
LTIKPLELYNFLEFERVGRSLCFFFLVPVVNFEEINIPELHLPPRVPTYYLRPISFPTMAPPVKTAIVTGACSGIGLALTKHLLSQTDITWRVLLVDINPDAFSTISSTLDPSRTLFLRTDVSSWADSAAMFKTAFDWPSLDHASGRIDFFAANAGIGDREHVFAHFDLDAEPTQPNLKCLEVNFLSVFYGLKLFIHHARKTQRSLASSDKLSPHDFNPNMAITASSAALYPFSFAPQYCASKHGLLGLTRSVGPTLLRDDNIAVNCICPAFVATNLAPPGIIESCPSEHLTPMSTIMRAFDELNVQSKKRKTGQAVECVEMELYYRDPVEFMCEGSRWLNVEAENGGFWNPSKTHST